MNERPVVHSIESNMFVRTRERPGRPAIVFVHGLGESGLCFEHLLAHRGLDAWSLHVVDLPGYGRSRWADEALSLPEFVEVIAEWVRARDLPRPRALVGHSMGGVIAILLAERHPELFDSLVNVDGNVSPPDCVFSGRAVAFDEPAFLREGFERLQDTVYRQGARDAAHRTYYASIRLADPRQFHRNSRELVAMSATEDLAARMGTLRPRSTYLAGVPRGAAERSLRLLEAAEVCWRAIEPSGHWPFVDRPDDFVRALVSAVG